MGIYTVTQKMLCASAFYSIKQSISELFI